MKEWRLGSRDGAALFAASMYAAFVFDYLLHFVIDAPDLHADVEPQSPGAPDAGTEPDSDDTPTEPGTDDQAADSPEPDGQDPDSTEPEGSSAESDTDDEPRTPERDEPSAEPNTTATYVRETEASVLVGGDGDADTTVHLPSGRWTAHVSVRDNTGDFVVVLGRQNVDCDNWPLGITLIDDVLTDGDRGFAVRPFDIGRGAIDWCPPGPFSLEVTATGSWSVIFEPYSEHIVERSGIDDSGTILTVTGSGPAEAVISLGAGSWVAQSSVTGNGGDAFTVALVGPNVNCHYPFRKVTLASLNGDSVSGNSTLPVLIGESDDSWCKPGPIFLGVSATGKWKVELTDVSDPSDNNRLTVGGIELRPVRPQAKTGSEPHDPTFTQISVGDRYACGVTPDRSIECWGSDNTWDQASAPTGEYLQVAAGDNHTCALSTQNTVHCWGDGYYGQTASPDGEFIQVMTADRISCALRADGSFACWGSLDGYSLGDVESPPDLRLASLGEGDLCGLHDDKTMACWYFRRGESYNDPYRVQLTDALAGTFTHAGSRCGTRTDGSVTCWYASGPDPASPPSGSKFSQTSDLCGITTEGRIECWDREYLGISLTVEGWRPPDPGELPAGGFSDVSVGGFRDASSVACAVRSDGALACWGGTSRWPTDPPAGAYTAVSVGRYRACAVEVGGDLEGWSWRDEELEGAGVRAPGDPPTVRFGSVSVTTSYACGLRTNGSVECWGMGTIGKAPPPNIKFTQISVGPTYACGVGTDGRVRCWG